MPQRPFDVGLNSTLLITKPINRLLLCRWPRDPPPHCRAPSIGRIASGMVVNGAKHALAVAASLAASDRCGKKKEKKKRKNEPPPHTRQRTTAIQPPVYDVQGIHIRRDCLGADPCPVFSSHISSDLACAAAAYAAVPSSGRFVHSI